MSEPVSWLGALIPSLTPEMEVNIFLNFVPLLLFFSICIHILMTVLLPKSGWIRLKARLSRDCVIVQLFTDEGFEKVELMKSDLGQGILSGNPISYIFTPRPPVIAEGDAKELVDLSPDIKANLDEALTHRFITDTGKALFMGYVGKSVAVTPKLAKIIKEVHGKKKLKLKKKTDEEVDEAPIEVRLLTLLNPLLLKLYIGRTFTRSLIESIKAENERKGFLRKPAPMAFLSNNPIPIILILIVILVVGSVLTGGIDLQAMFGLG